MKLKEKYKGLSDDEITTSEFAMFPRLQQEEREYFRNLYSRLETYFNSSMKILIYHLKIFNNILNATSDAAVLQGEIFMKMYSTRNYVDRKIRKLLGKEFTEEEKTEIIYLFSEYIINGGKK